MGRFVNVLVGERQELAQRSGGPLRGDASASVAFWWKQLSDHGRGISL